MATAEASRRNKHLILDQAKLERAQRVLGARTETETIERALERVITEDEREQRAQAATARLLKSGIEVKDVFGRLGEE
jgi:hypothetical protein